jgi:oligopeptide transport system substrate-binding protein
MLSLPPYRPLPREAIENRKGRWTDLERIQVSGPYQLTARKKGQVTILRKNEKYYDADSVSIPEIRYYVTPESQVGLTMYQNDQLDVMGGDYLSVPVDALSTIRASRVLSSQYSKISSLGVYAYGFNVQKSPVDNPLARKAIAACLDRDLLVNLAAKGGQTPAWMFTPPGLLSKEAAGETPCVEFNPVNGKKWLAQAGYPGGKGFPELTLFHNASERDAEIARALQTLLKHYLNIRVRLLEGLWGQDMKSAISKDAPHMFQFKWRADDLRPEAVLEEYFHPVNSFNPSGWVHPEFAGLLERAGEVSDQREMEKMLLKAETILCREECVAAPIYFETTHYLVKPRVEGWRPSLMGGQHIRDWSLKK